MGKAKMTKAEKEDLKGYLARRYDWDAIGMFTTKEMYDIIPSDGDPTAYSIEGGRIKPIVGGDRINHNYAVIEIAENWRGGVWEKLTRRWDYVKGRLFSLHRSQPEMVMAILVMVMCAVGCSLALLSAV